MAEITLTEQVSIITLCCIPAVAEGEILCSLFTLAASEDVNIDMISKAALSADTTSVGFTFCDEDMPKMLRIIGKMKLPRAPLVSYGNVKITVKSNEMASETGFAAKFFGVLNNLKITPLLITTAVDEISAVVRFSDVGVVGEKINILFKRDN